MKVKFETEMEIIRITGTKTNLYKISNMLGKTVKYDTEKEVLIIGKKKTKKGDYVVSYSVGEKSFFTTYDKEKYDLFVKKGVITKL